MGRNHQRTSWANYVDSFGVPIPFEPGAPELQRGEVYTVIATQPGRPSAVGRFPNVTLARTWADRAHPDARITIRRYTDRFPRGQVLLKREPRGTWRSQPC